MKFQRGGTFLGFIIGVVVGLGAALAVAVYVTKVPIPFVNRGQTRSADQDQAEAQKNKDWNPNAPLYGKNPARPPQAAVPLVVSSSPESKASGKVEEKSLAKSDAKAGVKEFKPAVSADPLGDLAKSKAGVPAEDAFAYWIQVGAFRTPEDAEAHRAKLSLAGVESRISEREQSGRMVYRVRVGPFENKEDAEQSKEKLEKSGLETALVRVQR